MYKQVQILGKCNLKVTGGLFDSDLNRFLTTGNTLEVIGLHWYRQGPHSLPLYPFIISATLCINPSGLAAA